MKKNSTYIVWFLVAACAISQSVPLFAMEQQYANVSEEKKNKVKELIALYKETRELYKKKKAGNASKQELDELKARMKKMRNAAIAMIGTAAFFAAVTGVSALARYFHKRGKTKNALVEAARTGNEPLVAELIRTGEYQTSYYKALKWAAKNGYESIARLLLQQNAYAYPIPGKADPLFAAAKSGHLELVKLLLPHKQTTYPGDFNPLYGAVKNSNLNIATFLLQNGFDPSITDIEKLSLLHIATKSNDTKMIELLLQRGAHPNQAQGNTGWTALHIAAKQGNPLTTKILLIDKRTEQKDSQYGTPLYYAALSGNEDVVNQLLQKGGNPNIRQEYLPLHAAAQKGHTAIVKRLLNKDALIDTKNINGNTALHIAAKNKHLPTVKMLAQKNANLFSENNEGKTPIEVTTSEEIQTYLQSQMNKSPRWKFWKKAKEFIQPSTSP